MLIVLRSLRIFLTSLVFDACLKVDQEIGLQLGMELSQIRPLNRDILTVKTLRHALQAIVWIGDYLEKRLR